MLLFEVYLPEMECKRFWNGEVCRKGVFGVLKLGNSEMVSLSNLIRWYDELRSGQVGNDIPHIFPRRDLLLRYDRRHLQCLVRSCKVKCMAEVLLSSDIRLSRNCELPTTKRFGSIRALKARDMPGS